MTRTKKKQVSGKRKKSDDDPATPEEETQELLPLRKGSHVLVLQKDNHNTLTEDQESGIVLQVGCSYNHRSTATAAGSTSSSSLPVVVCHDGIMVKLLVTNTRSIYPPSRVVRALSSNNSGDKSPLDKDDDESSRAMAVRRRRTSHSTCTTTTSSSTSSASHVTPPSKTNRSSTSKVQTTTAENRARVTPSPTLVSALEVIVVPNKTVTKVKSSHKTTQQEKASKYFPDSGSDGEEDASSDEPLTMLRKRQKGTKQTSKKGDDATSKKRAKDEKEDGTKKKTVPAKKTSKKGRPPAKRKTTGDDATSKKRAKDEKEHGTKKTAPPKKKPAKKKTKEPPAPPVEEDDRMLRASDTDSDDEKEDIPFRVEYATTGRATCKGCDERIAKDSLRVAERPLFRGKPGFVVYRHLHCTVFDTEKVESMCDVGGWRRLKNEGHRQQVRDRIVVSKELIEQEQLELQPDELVQVAFQGETRSAPKGLTASLLPFQVEGVSWMYHQEVHTPEIRGGVLADEMGMGKTLQTITTILDNRPKLQHCKPGMKHPPSAPDLDDRTHEENLWNESLKSWEHEMKMVNVPQKLLQSKKKQLSPMGARAGTLVICPVIALYQWREEIKKFTEETALTVCCYHGPNRAKDFPREVLIKYDVVLTTYQVVEADFRKMVSPNKVKCPNCGGSFKIDKLRVHLKYFCGETAQRTEAQARQRRTAGRSQQRGPRGGGSHGKKKKGKTFSKKKVMSKPPMKSQSTKQTKSMSKVLRKKVRLTTTSPSDSDSDEISIPENLDLSAGRPSRAAAKTASKRLSASSKAWGNASQSESDFSSDNESSDGDDESCSTPQAPRRLKMKPPSKPGSDSEASSSSSSRDSVDKAALARATQKQKTLLSQAKKKGATNGKTAKGKEKKQAAKRGAKRKAPPKHFSSDSSDDSSDDVADDRDPMEGIDLEALMAEAMEGSRVSVLHTMCWWRIVLDEAHMIKSRSSQTAAASFALSGIHRWCLSGTPLQNRVGELYSLIRFLRIDPMAHYFCRKQGCGCKSIHYRMMHGRCQDCGCGSIQHYSHFNKYVLNPIQRAGYQGDGRRAMMKLKQEVLDKALLRRTKETRAADLNLPPRVVNIRTIRLHPREEDFYNALYMQTKSSFDDYVEEGTLLNNYAHIFDLLTKMRQAVDHPYLIVYSKKNCEKAVASGALVANGSVDCEICHEPPTDRIVSSCCKSAFCRSCVVDYMMPAVTGAQQEGGTRCPCCQKPLSIDLNQASCDVVDEGKLEVAKYASASHLMPSLKEMTHVSSGSILRRINLAEFSTSTKVDALVQELVAMRQQRPGSKALVFSQFVNMLDLVRWRLHSDPCLHDLGLGVRIIHGGMNVQSRDQALKDFRGDTSVRILLMSLKAGGVALNLTVANEVYLLDPWWNPAAEMQAIDRTHRLGQYRPIRAVRFIAEGTVEERVLQLQEKKRLVFDGTVGRDAASLKMLTVEDMKAMFV